MTPNNVDIAKVAPVYHLYTPAEVEEVISRLWKQSPEISLKNSPCCFLNWLNSVPLFFLYNLSCYGIWGFKLSEQNVLFWLVTGVSQSFSAIFKLIRIFCQWYSFQIVNSSQDMCDHSKSLTSKSPTWINKTCLLSIFPHENMYISKDCGSQGAACF